MQLRDPARLGRRQGRGQEEGLVSQHHLVHAGPRHHHHLHIIVNRIPLLLLLPPPAPALAPGGGRSGAAPRLHAAAAAAAAAGRGGVRLLLLLLAGRGALVLVEGGGPRVEHPEEARAEEGPEARFEGVDVAVQVGVAGLFEEGVCMCVYGVVVRSSHVIGYVGLVGPTPRPKDVNEEGTQIQLKTHPATAISSTQACSAATPSRMARRS